ncbi:MAG TPA: hypothetical protein VF806_08120 [Anaerolineaceae bacterium]
MESLTDILTVLIGVIFVYLILSMVVSYVVELIAGWLNWRGNVLADFIQLLLNPSVQKLAGAAQYKLFLKQRLNAWYVAPQVVETPAGLPVAAPPQSARDRITALVQDNVENLIGIFYTHPSITTLTKPGKLPAYISPQDFTTTLLDILAVVGGDGSFSALSTQALTPDEFFTQIKNGLDSLGCEPLKTALLPYIIQAQITEQDAEKRIEVLRDAIINWFNNSMDRASGWYKRHTQRIAIGIALIVALAINADTIDIFQRLWQDASLRQIVSAAAEQYVTANPNGPAGAANPGAAAATPIPPDQALAQLQKYQSILPLPLGWSRFPIPVLAEDGSVPPTPGATAWIIFAKLVGLIITTLAISQGSSIWFQMLSKLIDLRNVGVKPSPPEPRSTETASAHLKPGQISIDAKTQS